MTKWLVQVTVHTKRGPIVRSTTIEADSLGAAMAAPDDDEDFFGELFGGASEPDPADVTGLVLRITKVS